MEKKEVSREIKGDAVSELVPRTEQRTARVLLINTGGTISMTEQDGGLAPLKGNLQEQIKLIDMTSPGLPALDILEWEPIIDSSDMRPENWVKLAQQIGAHYYDYDGFVIAHGTDTLAYTASALSFMLDGLAKTVVLTGSMIPLSALISDARRNLLMALKLAAQSIIPEVVILFNSQVLRGNRARKLSPNRADAFASPNCRPLADWGVSLDFNFDVIRSAPRHRFRTCSRLHKDVVTFVVTPNFDARAISVYSKAVRGAGIVLVLFGTGNAPVRHADFVAAIKEAIKEHEAEVVAISQCMHGSVDMTQYQTGSLMRSLGVIDGKDMTPEAVVAKLSYLMGRGLRGKALREAMETDIRGELTCKQRSPALADDHLISKL